MSSFRAVLRDPGSPDGGSTRLAILADAALMPGDVDVQVSLSALNRRDALLACGRASLDGPHPLVLGSDFAGVVIRSSHPRWREGDQVIATGRGLGRTHHGGWAERARVSGNWLEPQPDGLTPFQAMAIGSAGLAAMQAAIALDCHGVAAETGPILVTGATGGVGSLGVLALTCLGFSVTAATGRPELAAYLRSLGATEVIAIDELGSGGELGPERWAGAVDCLGGTALARLLATTRRGGAVVSLGNAACDRTTIRLAPFTSRAVAVLGVDAVHATRSRRQEAWERWAECELGQLNALARVLPLDDVLVAADGMLGRRSHGRAVVDLAGSRETQTAILH